jgi:hypothetical protein
LRSLLLLACCSGSQYIYQWLHQTSYHMTPTALHEIQYDWLYYPNRLDWWWNLWFWKFPQLANYRCYCCLAYLVRTTQTQLHYHQCSSIF